MSRINSRLMTKAIFIGFTGLMLSISTTASAEPDHTTSRVGVNASDIDLSSPAGIEKLQRRVASAIRLACAPVEFGGAISFGIRDQAVAQNYCLTNAHASAAPQVQKLVARGNIKVASY